MKYLLLISLIFLTGCGASDFYNLVGHRRFKAGDCLMTGLNEVERWNSTSPVYIVIELGKRNYRTKFISDGKITKLENDISYGHLWEDFYQKVDCGDLKERE